jgi:hypothetical protein
MGEVIEVPRGEYEYRTVAELVWAHVYGPSIMGVTWDDKGFKVKKIPGEEAWVVVNGKLQAANVNWWED